MIFTLHAQTQQTVTAQTCEWFLQTNDTSAFLIMLRTYLYTICMSCCLKKGAVYKETLLWSSLLLCSYFVLSLWNSTHTGVCLWACWRLTYSKTSMELFLGLREHVLSYKPSPILYCSNEDVQAGWRLHKMMSYRASQHAAGAQHCERCGSGHHLLKFRLV